MKKMGIEALYRKPNTSRRHAAHPIYLTDNYLIYLLLCFGLTTPDD